MSAGVCSRHERRRPAPVGSAPIRSQTGVGSDWSARFRSDQDEACFRQTGLESTHRQAGGNTAEGRMTPVRYHAQAW